MIGLSALFTSCMTPAASWPTAARRRSRARASWSASSSLRALLHHALETLGFRRHALVELGGAPRFFLEAFASCVFTVTSRSTVTAPRILPCSS